MPAVIPELVYVIGLFFAVVGYLAARGLLATWTHSLGFALQWLGTHARIKIPLPHFRDVHIDFGGPFRAADHAIITALQTWADGAEIEMGYCLHGMEKVARYTAQAIDFLAHETAQTFEWLTHVKLRQILRAFSLPVLLALLLPKLIRAVLPHVHAIVYKPVQIIYRTVPHTAARVAHKVVAHTIPGAHAIPRIEHQIVGLTRRNLRLSKRLHRVESLFGVAAMAAVMANVLGLPNWRCLTRGNIGRTSRALCGIPSHLLNDFLGILADIWILENVCVLLPFLERAASDIGVPMVAALTDVGAGICKGSKAPGALRGSVAVLPPVLVGASGLV